MTIVEFLNREEGGVEMLVGERKRRAIRDPEGWGIDEAREELRKKLADGGGEEEARGSRFDTTIEFTTSSGETSKPWGVLPDMLVRVGKLTLPVDIAVTGANTYDWIYSANADILTSKGKIVFQVNTTETDSVPITTGPLGGGGRPSYVLLPSHTTHRNINEDEERIKEWMEEQDFLKWTEEWRVAMAEEEGGMELNAEEEDEYYLWLREQDEEGDKEEESSEEEEEEEKELKVVDGEEEAWGYDFGSPTAEEVGAWESAGLGIDWDKEYDEMVEKYVGEVNETKWEGDSMVDGEEYLDYEWEEGELVYDKRRKPISTDHFFEMYNYSAEKWNYVAVESGDEGRIILGSYYTLKKEVPRVACPAFEDLPVSLNHKLDKQQQKEVQTLLVGYKEVFSTEKETLGTHPTIRLHIATGSAKPIAHKLYRVSPSERARIEEVVQTLLEQEVIRPSNSPWSSPCIVIPKKDFGDRVVIDYRPLNAVTEAADQFPMWRIDDILDRMTGSLYFSVLDVKSAYHTILVAEEDGLCQVLGSVRVRCIWA
ncbi:unnamed protein product [Closterium sp. NIES-64]|nr:unnamed protein product [Closterium sp. NIES-64]